VEATCDRILIINRGKIVADGTSDLLRKQASGEELLRIRIEEGDPNEVFKALKALPSVGQVNFLDGENTRYELQCNPGSGTAREVFRMCVTNQWILTEMIPYETKLEDVFRELTTH